MAGNEKLSLLLFLVHSEPGQYSLSIWIILYTGQCNVCLLVPCEKLQLSLNYPVFGVLCVMYLMRYFSLWHEALVFYRCDKYCD